MIVCEDLKIIQTLIDEAVENNIDVTKQALYPIPSGRGYKAIGASR